MSSRANDSDSPTLATLRRYYKERRPFGFTQATAYRLGRYAAQRNMAIYDYGAHSRAWINQFEAGKDDETRLGDTRIR
jgi:hypothetical protein